MIQKRGPVFETNSSSVHSISICHNGDILDLLAKDGDTCTIHGGEFGWKEDCFTDAATKASYVATYAVHYGPHELIEMLMDVVKEVMDVEYVLFDVSDDDYIDHQSLGGDDAIALVAFQSRKHLKDFIFNRQSTLITGNDNN